jgi:hypothetical protein
MQLFGLASHANYALCMIGATKDLLRLRLPAAMTCHLLSCAVGRAVSRRASSGPALVTTSWGGMMPLPCLPFWCADSEVLLLLLLLLLDCCCCWTAAAAAAAAVMTDMDQSGQIEFSEFLMMFQVNTAAGTAVHTTVLWLLDCHPITPASQFLHL